MGDVAVPLRVVRTSAPIRICDNGGWTDTWFAGHGNVFNIAVSPRVHVQLTAYPMGSLENRVVLHALNYGEHYAFDPRTLPGRHRLLEATVDEIGIPDDVALEMAVSSAVPPGCSTGTSAAVTVALVGALDVLRRGSMTPSEVAAASHRIEVRRLGVQSGVQDQLCAAHGGINYIEMAAYPRATVLHLRLPEWLWRELDRRLVLVYLGRPHRSSQVHDKVAAALAGTGENSPLLEDLRRAAKAARAAVEAGDLAAFGRAMNRNTEAQRRLHPELVSEAAQVAIDLAAAHGALGWKVNGAGGEGGSVTILCGAASSAKRGLLRAIRRVAPSFEVVPTKLSRRGLRTWQS